jgi:serine/threonine protein kinase
MTRESQVAPDSGAGYEDGTPTPYPGLRSGGTPPEADPQTGDIISGRFRLERLLGEGGMGQVFLAVDLLYQEEFKDRQSQVAIKFLGREFAEHAMSRMALQRETRNSQQLSHPNIVRVMHFDQHGNLPYMLMEHLEGQPLKDWMFQNSAGTADFDQALSMIEDMAAGLDYIHSQGLVHSDFKPANCFVTKDGEIKILDLGIARAAEASIREEGETAFDAGSLGAMTPAYASCEMFEGLDPDPRDDVYALACVAYLLLSGHHPFRRETSVKARAAGLQPERVAGLNNRRWAALKSGLAFARADRLTSAGALARGLRDERQIGKPMILGLSAVAALAVVLAVSIGMVAMQPPDPDELFLDEFTPKGVRELSSEEQSRISNWLEQGRFYMDVSRQEFESGELASALHVIAGGADNAYKAFESVLKLTPDPEARAGMLELINSVADWAEAVAREGDYEIAMDTACEGLKLHPGHERLNRLVSDYASDLGLDAGLGRASC